MFSFKVEGKTDEVKQMLKDAKWEHPKAAAAALNRTANTIRSRAVKSIAGDLGIKQKMVSPAVKTERATAAKVAAVINATGKGISAILLKPDPKKLIRPQPGKGVSFQVSEGRRKFVQGAFIARMHKRFGNMKLGVWQRKGKERQPVRMIKGPSIPGVFESIQKQLRVVFSERFPIEFRSALKFYSLKGIFK